MQERFISSTLNKKDSVAEQSLRPLKFADFPGQEKIKEQLELRKHYEKMLLALRQEQKAITKIMEGLA